MVGDVDYVYDKIMGLAQEYAKMVFEREFEVDQRNEVGEGQGYHGKRDRFVKIRR